MTNTPAQPQLDHKMGSPFKQVIKSFWFYFIYLTSKKTQTKSTIKLQIFINLIERTYQQNAMLRWIFHISKRPFNFIKSNKTGYKHKQAQWTTKISHKLSFYIRLNSKIFIIFFPFFSTTQKSISDKAKIIRFKRGT